MVSALAAKRGEIMDIGVGDKLYIEFVKDGSVWTQNVTNQTNMMKVTFDRYLEGQKQVEVLWDIEIQTRNRPKDDVIILNNVIKLAASNPNACVARSKGQNDCFSQPRASADGKTC